jgi:PLP dependent protein
VSPEREIAECVTEIRERIAAAARRAGRAPEDVTLVAVTKTVPVSRMAAAVSAGVTDLGENRAQELLAKAPVLAGGSDLTGPLAPRWHFVGALQRNKVRPLAPWVRCWQSVDRHEVGALIARHAPGSSVLIEVNLGEEPQKPGCRREATGELAEALHGYGLAVRGLMTVPPIGDDPRSCFAALRRLAEQLKLPELSMGMSDDFEAAIAEGATIVRIGRALFGDRPAARATGHDPSASGLPRDGRLH